MTRFERDELYRRASHPRTVEPPRDGDSEPFEDEGRFEDDGRPEDDGRDEWSAAQKRIWDREQTYWELVAAGDAERFVALWDERFVGWLDTEEPPVTGSDPRVVVADRFEDVRPNELGYALDPLAVVVSGNVGVTCYSARIEHREGRGEERTERRMTHAWRKTENEWKLVGEMTASNRDD